MTRQTKWWWDTLTVKRPKKEAGINTSGNGGVWGSVIMCYACPSRSIKTVWLVFSLYSMRVKTKLPFAIMKYPIPGISMDMDPVLLLSLWGE
ncbi:MAG: hypothetical protein U5K32_03715 [Bacteroidales bacterium]|nr:hypothetical protein [Bacteroidales bacterium]